MKIPKYVSKIKIYKVVAFVTAEQKKKERECLFCGKGPLFITARYFNCDGCGAKMDCIGFLMHACKYTLKQALERLRFDKDIFT